MPPAVLEPDERSVTVGFLKIAFGTVMRFAASGSGSPVLLVEQAVPKYGLSILARRASIATRARVVELESGPTASVKAAGATAGYSREPVGADSEHSPVCVFALAVNTPTTL